MLWIFVRCIERPVWIKQILRVLLPHATHGSMSGNPRSYRSRGTAQGLKVCIPLSRTCGDIVEVTADVWSCGQGHFVGRQSKIFPLHTAVAAITSMYTKQLDCLPIVTSAVHRNEHKIDEDQQGPSRQRKCHVRARGPPTCHPCLECPFLEIRKILWSTSQVH